MRHLAIAAAAALTIPFTLQARAADVVQIHLEGQVDNINYCPNRTVGESCDPNPVSSFGVLAVGQRFGSDITLDLAPNGANFQVTLASTDGLASYAGTGPREFFPLLAGDQVQLMLNLGSTNGGIPGSLATFTYSFQFAAGTFSKLPTGAELVAAVQAGKLEGTTGGGALFGCSATPGPLPCGYVGLAIDKVSVSAVPEPSSLVLCSLGLAAAAGMRRARKA
ncbi:MAG: PEP-CTERM sorting domain-containing protein [Myxococcales bacterium]